MLRLGPASAPKVAQIAIAAAWVIATGGIEWRFGGRFLNLGFVAALAFASLAIFLDRASLPSIRECRLLKALGLGALAFLVPALAHGTSARLGLGALRGCAALLWFAILLAPGQLSARKALPWAALALLTANVAFALLSLCLPESASAFETVRHEYAGGIPRFRGFANTPAPAGIWAIVAIALGEGLPNRRLRWLTRGLGLVESCATLSVALLAAPALLFGLLSQRRLRTVLVLGATVFAGAILYFQPLQLAIGSRTLVLSQLHPNYAVDGLGPKYMPQRLVNLPGTTLRGHFTAYGMLAGRGLTCFAEHPLAGVGPGRFKEACPVMAMNTFGEWKDQRDSHNQLAGILSELGCVGIALLSAAWLTLRREYSVKELLPWERAAWLALLVCCLGSEAFLTLPVLALLSVQLRRRVTTNDKRAVAGAALAHPDAKPI